MNILNMIVKTKYWYTGPVGSGMSIEKTKIRDKQQIHGSSTVYKSLLYAIIWHVLNELTRLCSCYNLCSNQIDFTTDKGIQYGYLIIQCY